MKPNRPKLRVMKAAARQNPKLLISCLLLGLCASLISLPLAAQSVSFSSSSSIDWEQGLLHTEITASTRGVNQNPASAATTATRNIFNEKKTFLLQALLKVRVDSRRTLSDIARENPSILRDLERFADGAQAGPSRISTDLSQVSVPFSLKLYPGLTELLVRHTKASPLDAAFQWQGLSNYTGLVIYAAEELPARGEREKGQQVETLAQPALFIDLYDPNLNFISEPNRLEPGYLIQWGAVAYTSGFDETAFLDRIGSRPLRVTAREIFGIHPTDLILSQETKDNLLTSPENRRFLQEGRVLVILSPDRLIEKLD